MNSKQSFANDSKIIYKEQELLKLAKKRQTTKWEGYKNIGDYYDGVYECDFVSPYSKSAHNLNADIMIILQDWSSDKSLSGVIDDDSITYGHSRSIPTNINLKKLLKEHLDATLDKTYGTNLFPFIKMGTMSANIPSKFYKKAALEFALPQINIISPKIVICLGLATFNGLKKAYNLKPSKNMEDAINNPFKYGSSMIFCQAHTGILGQNNRNRGGVNRVNRDWKKMGSYLRELSK